MAAKTAKNRKPAGRFKKGQSGNPLGRRKGTPNRTTGILKDAILMAAANVGDWFATEMIERLHESGKPSDGVNGGLVGYLEFLARGEPKSFAPLLGKVLPLVIKGDIDVTIMERAQRQAEHFTERLQRLVDRNGMN